MDVSRLLVEKVYVKFLSQLEKYEY
jgi:hypothetical protein